MKLSEQLKQDHDSGDFGKALYGYAERAALLEDEIEKLRTALRLVMSCAGDIDAAADADLEAALECGDAETEKQANAWLVARAFLMPNDQIEE